MANATPCDVRIGMSGWRYEPWRGTFYPEDLAQKRELEYASRQVNSIEINGTFYSMQRPSSFAAWRDATPGGFVFAVKGPRYLTHMRKLREVEVPLANFLASGVLSLKDKLGPFLWQLPPNFTYDREKLARFFDLLPRDVRSAVKQAKGHDAWLKGRTSFESGPAAGRLRHAIEVRHPTFETPDFVALLRAHDIALVVADTAGKWPVMEDLTSDFVYARLHGDKELYVSGYTPEALAAWGNKVVAWRSGTEVPGAKRTGTALPARPAGRDVYVYFDNDVKVRAPADARSLMRYVAGGGGGGGSAPMTADDLRRAVEDFGTVAEKARLVAAEHPELGWRGYGGEASRRRKARFAKPAGAPAKAAKRSPSRPTKPAPKGTAVTKAARQAKPAAAGLAKSRPKATAAAARAKRPRKPAP